MPGRILIVDDHPICSKAIALAVRDAVPGVETDQTATLYMAEQAARHFPDYRFVLLDFILPDAVGFSGLLRLQQILPHVPIAIISGLENAEMKAKALHYGAAAFLTKALPFEALSAAIARIAAGRREIASVHYPESNTVSALHARFNTLTTCQLRVVMALRTGESTKQIAHRLQLGEATIKAHLGAAFRKLGVVNRAQAMLALQHFEVETNAKQN